MRLMLLVATAVALLLLGRALDAGAWLGAALAWIRDLGPVAPLVFLPLYVIACVLLLPGSVLTLGAGAVFGVPRGFVIVWISATLGATAAFLVGRYLVRDWVAGKIAANPKLQALDATVTREGWKIVVLMRLCLRLQRGSSVRGWGLTAGGRGTCGRGAAAEGVDVDYPLDLLVHRSRW